MSGAGPRGGIDAEFDAQVYRERIAKFTDAQLIEEGAYYRKVVGYRLKPDNPRFQGMLNECMAAEAEMKNGHSQKGKPSLSFFISSNFSVAPCISVRSSW
jgi:hypothetical protein